ncbi:hypothetical protein UT300012_21540 [Paraclostridium bifermentans]
MAYGKNELIDNTRYLTEEKLKSNKENFIKLAGLIKRDGIEDLMAWLETTDFYSAPASTKFHGNFEGFLVMHSTNVANCLQKMNSSFSLGIPVESVLICGLFHDLCKVNLYKRVKRVFKDDDANGGKGKWYDYMTYVFDDSESAPLGHGEKSVMKIMEFMKLSTLEQVMIRWHMGAYEEGALKNGLNNAFDYHKGVSALAIADMQASNFLEFGLDHKELPEVKAERLRRMAFEEVEKRKNVEGKA